ncbi:hypothetical protein Golob_004343, partial [Gossypium lobatum]|nr:hypothetical protein [Gossypium lobatum]
AFVADYQVICLDRDPGVVEGCIVIRLYIAYELCTLVPWCGVVTSVASNLVCLVTRVSVFVNLVQVHDIPPRFFSEVLARQLGNFIKHFVKYDGESIARGIRSYMRIKLGHSDYFYEERMSIGFEIAEIGWGTIFTSEETSMEHHSEEVVLEREKGKKRSRQTLGEDRTTLAIDGFQKASRSVAMKIITEGSRGGLCLAWKGNVTISLKSFSISYVDVEVEEDDGVCSSYWDGSQGPLLEKLVGLQTCLVQWSRGIARKRNGIKEKLMRLLEALLEEDVNDKNLAHIIDTKIHFSLEIDKENISGSNALVQTS